MTSGEQSYSTRSFFIWSQWAREILDGRHMRGLDENIWKVFAPIAWARSAAVKTPPVVERCMPIRFGIVSSFESRCDIVSMVDLRCSLREFPRDRVKKVFTARRLFA